MKSSIKSILMTILLITAIMLFVTMGSMIANIYQPAYATEIHTHAICGVGDCTALHPDHSAEVEYQPLSPTDGKITTTELTTGNYYLTDNAELTETLYATGTVTLCLNGKRLDCVSFLLDTTEGAVFNVCDCSAEEGSINYSSGSGTVIIARKNAQVNIYGGNINGGIISGDNGHLTVYGGTITKGSNVLKGSGTTSRITINGGTVAATSDIAIITYNFLTINGGTITSPKTAIKIDKPTISEELHINITGGEVVGNPALYTVFEVPYDVDRETRRINITGGRLTNYNNVGSEISVIKIDSGYVHISKCEIEMPYSKSTPATCIVVSGQGHLTIDPNTDDDVLIKSEKWGVYVRDLSGGPSGGRIKINGGKFTTSNNCVYVMTDCNISQVEINGGYFEAESQAPLQCGAYTYVNGGTFGFKDGRQGAIVIHATEFLTITGSPTINGLVDVWSTGKYTQNTPNRYYFDITGYTGQSIITLSMSQAMLSPTHNQVLFAGSSDQVLWQGSVEYGLGNSYDDDLDVSVVVFKHKAHTGGTPTCTDKAICEVCYTQYGDLVAHTEGIPASCTSPAICAVCSQTYGDTIPHTYMHSYDTAYHWEECQECNDVVNKVVHNGGTATCSTLARCVDCQQEYGETTPHEYGAYIQDAVFHWKECEDCGALSQKMVHAYADWSDYVDNGDGTKTKTSACVCDKVIGLTLKVTQETNASFEQECIERGTTLEMSVVADSANITEESKAAIQEHVLEEQTVVYFDITILDAVANLAIGNTNNVLEIPVSFDTTNRGAFEIYRNHDGRVDKFTLLEERPTDNYVDGTYYVEEGVIYVYTSQFSTYAVAYQDAPVALVVGVFGGLLILIGIMALVIIGLARSDRKRAQQLAEALAEQECQKLFKKDTHPVVEEDANQKALDWVKQHFWKG